MTPEEAFLADIRERPDDDVPRRIFADWLEDHGDPDRAAFLRLMLDAARQADNAVLLDAAAELLLRHWPRLVGPLLHIIGRSSHEPWLSAAPSRAAIEHFPRGFVNHLNHDVPRLVAQAEAIFRVAPLTSLALYGAGGLAHQLAGCPELRWVRRLSFTDYYSSPLGAADAAALAASPHLMRLRQLNLFRNNLADAGVGELARAEWLAGLHALDLTENGLSADAARLLTESPRIQRLRHLALSRNAIGDLGAEVLSHAPWLRHLETLSLERAGLSPRGLLWLRRAAPGVRLFVESPLTGRFTPG